MDKPDLIFRSRRVVMPETVGSYQLSYNADELMIFRFMPEGKCINKFVETYNFCGISPFDRTVTFIPMFAAERRRMACGFFTSSII